MKNFGVDVTIVEFLDRMVPTEDADVSKELLKHYKKLGVNVLLSTKVLSIDDSGREGQGHRRPRRPAAGARGRQGPAGDRVRAAHPGLRPRQHRRAGLRPRRHRDRRPRPHQRRRRLRHRRRHGEADARARRRGDGHRRRRDDRRRGDDADRLRHGAAGDVLPAPDRLLRLQRGAGQGEGVRRQDGHLPVQRQRQGDGPRRGRRASSRSSPTPSTTSCWART